MSWPTQRLRDVAKIVRSAIDPEAIAAGTTYVGLEHIDGARGSVSAVRVTEGELGSTKFVFRRTQVLYGKLRPYLAKIACPDFDGVCSTDILPIEPGPDIDRRFLFWFLRQPAMVDYAASRTAGANLPRLSPDVLAAVPIPLPNLAEQRRITNILDRVDALRAKRREALAKLEELPQAIFRELVSADTATTALGDLIADGPQNGLYKPSSAYGDGTPIVRIDGFGNDADIRLSALKRLRTSAEERVTYGLRELDLLVNRVNSIEHLGKCTLVPPLAEPVVFESNMMRIRLKDTVEPTFVLQALRNAETKEQIARCAKHAVNQASINQQDVKGLRIPNPLESIQRQYANRVQAVLNLRSAYNKHLAKLDELFASLQHRAFRGEL